VAGVAIGLNLIMQQSFKKGYAPFQQSFVISPMKKTLLLATILFLLKTAAAQSRFEFGIHLYPNISSAIVMGEGLVAEFGLATGLIFK
jgi:hypothetical protein